jgi:hypothetical protein
MPAGELADRDGTYLAFATTRTPDDPRAPIAERYPTHDAYATRGRAVVSELQRERLLLVEDADGYLKRDRE